MVDPGSIIKKCIVFFTPRGQSGTHFEFARANSIMVFRHENFTVGGLKVMSEKVKNEPMFTKFIYISIYIYISIIIIYIYMYMYMYSLHALSGSSNPKKLDPKITPVRCEKQTYLGWKGQQIEVALLTGTASTSKIFSARLRGFPVDNKNGSLHSPSWVLWVHGKFKLSS